MFNIEFIFEVTGFFVKGSSVLVSPVKGSSVTVIAGSSVTILS